MKRICVFCGSNAGTDPAYHDAARALGHALAQREIGLVFGGGRVGLMGVVAEAVLEGGGQAIGVIPEHLIAKEVQHRALTELRIVKTMHERKAMMADLAEGFIALPGGFGTWDEFCEIVTWAQLGLHKKPCALLNVAGYYDALIGQFDRAAREGFVRSDHRAMLIIGHAPGDLLDRMRDYHAPTLEKWITRQDV
jgi:uncharacterized protein (TIGR00730 family)